MATLIVLTRSLDKHELATYQQTFLAYLLVAPFLQLGIDQGIFHFLSVEKLRIRGRVIDALTALGIAGVLFAVFIIVGGNQFLARSFDNPKVAEMLLWMAPYAILTLPGNQVSPVLISRDRIFLSSGFAILKQFVIGAATIAPLIVWRNAESPLIGNVVASCLMAIASIGLMIKATPNDSAKPDVEAMRELVRFSLPLGLSFLIGAIMTQMDKLIVSVAQSPESFAVYAVGAFEVPGLAIVTGSITAAIIADMTRRFKQGEGDSALALWNAASQKSALFLFPASVFLFAFSTEFISVVFSNRFTESAPIFQLYVVLLPLRIFLFGSILAAAGESGFILKRTAFWAISNLALSVSLYRAIGIEGVVWGTIISQYLLAAPMNFLKIKQVTHCQWSELAPARRLLRIALAAIGPILLVYPLKSILDSNWQTLALAFCIYAFATAIVYRLTRLISLSFPKGALSK